MNDEIANHTLQEMINDASSAEQSQRRPNTVPIQTGEQLFWHLIEQPEKFYDEYRMSVSCF